jgi:hypothetical protein
MATTWDEQRRRARAVRSVLSRLESRVDVSTLPWDDDTKAAFEDPDALLQALHTTWMHRLLARLDQALELGTEGSAAEAVGQAWRDTARSAPGLRRLLDAYAAAPALERGQDTERRLLAMAAGVAPSSLSGLSGTAETGAVLAESRHRPDVVPRRSRCPLGRRLKARQTSLAHG